MANGKERERELAYRFDLFIAPDWGERFDAIVAERVPTPAEGRFLEINCGTGARAIAVAASLVDGEVVGVDPHGERIAIARAKAHAANSERSSFVEADPERLGFEDESFDGVVLDTTLAAPERLGPLTTEAVRVARRDAPVAVKILLRGSFDEFFSVYWEALHDVGIAEEVWGSLERVIVEHPTFEEAVAAMRAAGLRDLETYRTKEEWRFESGAEFFESPLVTDLFLGEWLAIVPEDRVDEVRNGVAAIIDRESNGSYFDVSAKALVVSGKK